MKSIGSAAVAALAGLVPSFLFGNEPLDGLTSVGVAQQPDATLPPVQPLRELEWGDINVVHTTDTHGWLAGHILEPEFGGDWGDLVSFVEHLKARADAQGVDLLLVDTGDRHDGNGLSDASEVDSEHSLAVFRELEYDVVTIGNHELYRGEASLQEFHEMYAHFGERYVVSNVEVAVGRTWVPLGHKYRLFTTPVLGYRVLALGFLFNFEGNDREVTRVTRVEEEIKQPWFQDLLKDTLPTDVDYVLIAGHIPVRHAPEFAALLDVIRSVRPDIPVHMFGGHSHIRDYVVYDDAAVALESGRYMETIGWASANLSGGTTPKFARTYIDSNKRSLAFHAGVSVDKLSTDHGKNVSTQIAEIRADLNLDEHIADVPHTYFTDRAPFPSEDSLFSLLQDHVLPLLGSPEHLADKPRYIYLNTGAVRFDLFEGPYTKDTGYIVSPFKNAWFSIANVPRKVADKILPIINNEDRVVAMHSRTNFNGDVDELTTKIYGYRTKDDLGTTGDDTVHRPWKFHQMPNAFVSQDKVDDTTEAVTLVFHDFMASFIEKALRTLGRRDLYRPELHGGERIIELLPKYLAAV